MKAAKARGKLKRKATVKQEQATVRGPTQQEQATANKGDGNGELFHSAKRKRIREKATVKPTQQEQPVPTQKKKKDKGQDGRRHADATGSESKDKGGSGGTG